MLRSILLTAPLLLAALLSTGCAASTSARPLPPAAAARMAEVHLDTRAEGELIYRGRVQARHGDGAELYTYERWVLETAEGATATHITYAPDGALVVVQQTASAPDGRLSSFEELHGQLGLSGTIEQQADGSLLLDTVKEDRSRHAVEAPGHPVVAGPTLFGFVLDRWDSILAGEVQVVRFPVLDDGRTYPFTLELEHVDQSTVTVAMRAASPMVRLLVPQGRIVFDRDTRQVISYAGLVPPLMEDDGRLTRLDGEVIYTFAAETYK
jgi:hypothetical protein